jgi:hypothetical protein
VGAELRHLVGNAFDEQAHLSEFISDNYSASTHARMFTNRPRTVGLSLAWKY